MTGDNTGHEQLSIVRMVDWDSDYPDSPLDNDRERAVYDYCRANQIQICGMCHQHKPNGAPLFADGTVWRESIRNWGTSMCETWDRQPLPGDSTKHYNCWQCSDHLEHGDWDTRSGPLVSEEPTEPVDPRIEIIRRSTIFGWDVMYGCPVVRPELGVGFIETE